MSATFQNFGWERKIIKHCWWCEGRKNFRHNINIKGFEKRADGRFVIRTKNYDLLSQIFDIRFYEQNECICKSGGVVFINRNRFISAPIFCIRTFFLDVQERLFGFSFWGHFFELVLIVSLGS